MTKIDLKDRIDGLNTDAKKLFLLKLDETLLAENDKIIDSGRQSLVAYIQGTSKFEIDKFRKNLRTKLPEYMVPSSIVVLDDFPMLPNGKIDRKKLVKLEAVQAQNKPISVGENTTETEKVLTQIWEEVIGFSPININDNFFEIGGDSILSIQIISKARKQGLMISPNELFEHQTISSLSKSIEDKGTQIDKFKFLVPLRKEGSKKALFCIHSGGGHVFFYNLLTKYMKLGRPIYALQPSGLDGTQEDMHSTIEAMTTDYIKAMRAVQPEGPYNVLVYCFSVTVGNEMAVQLAKEGQKVNIIVMDTMASPWTLDSPERLKARVKSFFIRFIKYPISSIKTFFIDRFWRVSPIWVKFFGNENQKNLERLKVNLQRICVAYDFKNHSGKISLILTEKPHESLQKLTIDSWTELTTNDVDLFYTKGNHRKLFEDPDVRFVSEKIDEAIIE